MALTKVRRGGTDTGISDSSDATAITIDSSEKVGIGTTSVAAKLHVESASGSITPSGDADELLVEGSGASGITIGSGTSSYGSVRFADSGGDSQGQVGYDHSGNHMSFITNASEVCRIEADGDMYLGGNFGSAIRGGHQGIQIDMGSGQGEALITRTYDTSSAHLVTRSAQSGSGTHYLLYFENSSASNIGSITHNDSATSFNTSSDYRLKENVSTDWDATTRLKQLKPSRFNWKANKDKTVDGFLAHEVSSIVPEAITGDKDAVDENGNPQYQGIDQSKLVPLLTKALQEAMSEIDTLKEKVTALESK